MPEGKPIPSELRKEEAQLRKEVQLEDDNTAVRRSHIDDEYAHAGETDPKVLITTSRDPSSRLIQFAKVSTTNVEKLLNIMKRQSTAVATAVIGTVQLVLINRWLLLEICTRRLPMLMRRPRRLVQRATTVVSAHNHQ